MRSVSSLPGLLLSLQALPRTLMPVGNAELCYSLIISGQREQRRLCTYLRATCWRAKPCCMNYHLARRLSLPAYPLPPHAETTCFKRAASSLHHPHYDATCVLLNMDLCLSYSIYSVPCLADCLSLRILPISQRHAETL